MKYMGSKRKIAKDILPIILQNRKENQWYVEPFCGGCNLIDKVNGNRIASDINKYVIALFKYMQDNDDLNFGHIGENEYKNIQNNKDKYPDWLVGYVGFNLSFGAKFFGGYRRDKAGIRNYENEAQQNLKTQQKYIKDIKFFNCNYDELDIPNGSIIYCDIPYKDTTKYKTSKFDYDKFWDWCRVKSKQHEIYISEYNTPDDFKCLWEKEVVSSLDLDTGSKTAIEKLFTINNKNSKSLSLF